MRGFQAAAFGRSIANKRGKNGLRQTAREIGVSPATLKRVEAGGTPDLPNFAKMCRWLGADPAGILGVRVKRPAMKAPRQESARTLANCIMAASRAANARMRLFPDGPD